MTARDNSIEYRPEIDGLRALAVVPVLLYHAQLGAPGGFVGVDVFFVISGYLITSLLLKKVATARLDLLEFWERRIRRLFPALAVMTLATFVAGWFLLLPADYKELGESVSAQTLLSSNIFFWQHTGYFDSAANLKPLLHTWSLAVEEQFYLLYPLLLLGLAKLRRPTGGLVFISLCAVSFAVSVNDVAHHPEAAFYLLPSRLWELGLGAIVAALPRTIQYSAWIHELASWIALATIVYAISYYSASTPFPGLAALPPCGGAALFIQSNGPRLTSAGKFLSWRPVVFIGLISYSLYLWHWPILVFANYWALARPQFPIRIGLFCLCFLLAAASWKYVEIPCRNRGSEPRRTVVFLFGSAAAAILFILGSAISSFDGVNSRLPDAVVRVANGRSDFNPAFESQLTLGDAEAGRFLGLGSNMPNAPIQLMIWGDSHAMAALPALDYLCSENSVRAFAATHSSTPPLLDYVPQAIHSLRQDAPAFAKAVIRFVRAQHIPNVILIASWQGYKAGLSPEFNSDFRKTLTELHNSGAKIWIMQDVPFFYWDVPSALARAALFKIDLAKINLPLSLYLAQTADQEREFLRAAASDVIVLNPASYLSRGSIVPSSEKGFPIYRDHDHLSIHGATLIRPMFLPMFSSNQRVAIEPGTPTERPEVHSDLDLEILGRPQNFAHKPH
jgi:peptidoglycan/LPS O-acetylase OafA/YrhL